MGIMNEFWYNRGQFLWEYRRGHIIFTFSCKDLMRKSPLSFGPICTCKADLDPLQYSARLIKWGTVIRALMRSLMFLKERGWCHSDAIQVQEKFPLVRERSKPHLGTESFQQVIRMGSASCHQWSTVLSLRVDSLSEFPGLTKPSTQFPDPVLLQVIDRADMVPGFWLAFPGPWTQVYTLEVWAYEPLGMTLQIALFVTWTCDNYLWPWPSIFPSLHTVPCSVSPH